MHEKLKEDHREDHLHTGERSKEYLSYFISFPQLTFVMTPLAKKGR